jgi:site-specific DNA recombinase
MEQKPTKLIAVYGRVSTSNQENEGTIETQLSAVREFAKKNGYIIVHEYLDEGWSGDILARPSLDQLRMDAKKKNWEAVLTYDPDRLARRGAWQEVVIEELQELQVDVLFVTIPQAKTDEDKIMQKMRGVFTEYERMKIKERFRLGKVRKAKEGHIIATEAPYGYKFILKKGKPGDSDFHQGYYEVDEEESKIVSDIFSWVANEQLTLRGVVRRLQDLNITPRKSKRGVWSTSTLSTLLRNKTYIGEGHFGASYAVVPEKPTKKEGYRKVKKTSRRARPEEEWIKIKTPQIIEEDLFIRAGQRLKENFELCVRNTKNEYLLGGKIYCICGQRRCGEGPQKGKHLYYRCSDRVYSFPLPRSCYEKGINARIADDLVWGKISQMMSSPKLMNEQVERWVKNRQSESSFSPANLELLEKEVSKLREQEDRYNKAYGAGAFDLNKLKEYTLPIKQKIVLVEGQIVDQKQKVREQNTSSIPTREQIELFAEKSLQALKTLSFEAKKGIISGILEKVVGNQEKLQVCGYIPIIKQNDVEYFTNDWNCRSP